MTDPTYTHRTVVLMAEQAAKAGLPHIGACPFSWKFQPESMKLWMDIRHARNVAMDQTRKVYSNVNAARMQALGVKKFEWVHTGGSQHPRKDHQELSGKVFSLDDLPVIGVMYGNEVRGKPGDLPYCRCTMRPIVSFED